MKNLLQWTTATVVVLTLGATDGRAQTGAKISLLWSQGLEPDAIAAEIAAPDRDLRVQVWHDREADDPYRRGERFQVHFRTDRDLYVVVYRIDTEGEVEVLWPTSRYDDGFVYGNHTYSLPRPGSPVRLTTGQQRGVEYVQAIASEYPFDLRGLGIDFAFDLDARDEYRYAVSGDPFLAVNDLNYAITGLEEDVDYVVTDWVHLYVDSKVDYPRYACSQCHDGNDRDVHPYVDTCSTVNIYNDWGWHRRWYVSFGWYPLYYEPPFYYWDIGFGRPYWYAYYPVYYSWPGYRVYARPYPLYWWDTSPHYRGDFRVRYTNGRTRVTPLYDLQGPSTRRAIRELDARERRSMPASVSRDRQEGRVAIDRLVRDGAPTRTRSSLTEERREDRRPTRVGIDRERTRSLDDARRRDERRITSLAPRGRELETDRGGDRPEVRRGDRSTPDRGERRWNRPVIRDDRRPSDGSGRDDRAREAPQVDRRREEGRARDPQVDRPSTDRRRDQREADRPRDERRQEERQVDRKRDERPNPPQVDRSRDGRTQRKQEVRRSDADRRNSAGRQGVERSGSSGERGRAQVERSAPAPRSRSEVGPSPRSSSGSSRQSSPPPRQGSSSRGGSSSSKSRGGSERGRG